MKENNDTNVSLQEAILQLQEQIKDVHSYVLSTGLTDLDLHDGGLHPGELCVIGARPGMGKTSFVLSVISNMVRCQIPVGLFSATDSLNVDFLSRVISSLKNVEDDPVREHGLDTILNTSLDDIPLFLNLNQRMTISYIRENATKLKNERGIKCLFVETIQSLFEYEGGCGARECMQMVCRELKILAQELNIPIIITSDLNRSPEYREGVGGRFHNCVICE